MKIVQYDKHKHFEKFKEIATKRNLLNLSYLPARGIVAEEDGCPIAFEFFYITDCGTLMIPHFFVTDPDVDREKRDDAIIKIFESLPIFGRAYGCRVIRSEINRNWGRFYEAAAKIFPNHSDTVTGELLL